MEEASDGKARRSKHAFQSKQDGSTYGAAARSPNAAGIDGRFKPVAPELPRLAYWLQACHIDSVAMEATACTGFRSTRSWKYAASRLCMLGM